MKGPKNKMPDSVFSLLMVLSCICMGSVILNVAINTSSAHEKNTLVTMFLICTALISLVGIICTIIFLKKGDNEK